MSSNSQDLTPVIDALPLQDVPDVKEEEIDFSAALGAAIPIMTIFFSDFINTFYVFAFQHNTCFPACRDAAVQQLDNSVRDDAFHLIELGVAVFIAGYLQMCLWMIAGERQANRLRTLYYSAVLRQDITFFDTVSTGDVTTRISGDISLFQEGISEKVGQVLQHAATLLGGFIIGFIKGWKLTLVLCAVFPLMAIAGAFMARALSRGTSEGQDAYAAAGGVAEQVFSGIRTVTAFGGQKHEIERYTAQLERAYILGRRKAFVSGTGLGSLMFFMFGCYGLAFWYGSILIVNHEMTGAEILNVFFAVFVGVEIGRHDELIEKQGVYFDLVRAQELETQKTAKKTNEEEDEEISSTSSNDDTAVIIDEKRHKLHLRKLSTKGSATKSIKTDEEIIKDMEKKLLQKMPLARVFRLCQPEYGLMFIGCIGAAVNGSIMPLFSLVFSSILDAFSRTDQLDELQRAANFSSMCFAILAVVAFLANFSQLSMFTLAGERLTKRLRKLTFEALLRQEIAYFDDEKNGTGVLTSKLAVDATKVEGLSGGLMGTVIQNLCNLAVGFGLAFGFGWKLTLVILAASPALVIAGFLEMRAMAAYEGTGQIVQQSVSNMRTIASLTREETFKTTYQNALREPHRIAIKGSLLSSFGFGTSQGILYFIWALSFWYGSKLVETDEYELQQMLRVMFAVLFTAVSLGQLAKSTIDPTDNEVISLLLRFYDVNSGEIEVEGVNVKQWNLEYLRANMALVGQEPVLFDLTIEQNIAESGRPVSNIQFRSTFFNYATLSSVFTYVCISVLAMLTSSPER
ncbi:4849_t:CDS:10 [Dentiscutata heterogama]|uniref:4849_t:CDS:1 n=1 Tax=Dentiscutata heterogama TaxID=1316150 RepID=A0ACA9KDU5_9GLOM|nr:4849_t:CDS:10 [Dentiscutata heterogama]